VSRDTAKPNRKSDDTSAGKSAGKPSAQGTSASAQAAGRVKFDDRGNAVWEWAVTTGAFGAEGSAQPLKRLDNPALSLADDAPTLFDTVKPNPLGTVKGYNPYDSGKLAKARAPRKKDLRKLSEWLRLRKQFNNKNPDEE
jgi:hypothetical protein